MSQAWKNDACHNVFDLDCKDIPEKRFTALQPDLHGLDGDKEDSHPNPLDRYF